MNMSSASRLVAPCIRNKNAFRKLEGVSYLEGLKKPVLVVGEDPGLLTQYVGIDSSGGKIRIKIQVIVQTFFEKLLHDKTLPFCLITGIIIHRDG